MSPTEKLRDWLDLHARRHYLAEGWQCWHPHERPGLKPYDPRRRFDLVYRKGSAIHWLNVTTLAAPPLAEREPDLFAVVGNAEGLWRVGSAGRELIHEWLRPERREWKSLHADHLAWISLQLDRMREALAEA